jgi:hypothetical protein
MNMKIAKFLFCALAASACCGSVQGQLLAIWDFGASSAYYTTAVTNTNLVGTPTLALGGGTLDADGKNGVDFTDAAGLFHAAGQAGAWDDVKVTGTDAYWIVTMNTTGWKDLVVRWDYKAWDATTTSCDLDYSLNGGTTWINILNNTAIIADGAFHTASYDLSSVLSLNDASSVQIRMNDLDEFGDGKFAFDNLQVTGAATPEPATLALLTLGAAVIRRLRA